MAPPPHLIKENLKEGDGGVINSPYGEGHRSSVIGKATNELRPMSNDPFAEGKYTCQGLSLRGSNLPEAGSHAEVSGSVRINDSTFRQSQDTQTAKRLTQVSQGSWLKVIYLAEGDEIAVVNMPDGIGHRS